MQGLDSLGRAPFCHQHVPRLSQPLPSFISDSLGHVLVETRDALSAPAANAAELSKPSRQQVLRHTRLFPETLRSSYRGRSWREESIGIPQIGRPEGPHREKSTWSQKNFVPQPGARTPLITWEVRASRGNKMMEPKKLCPQTPRKIPLVYLGGSRFAREQNDGAKKPFVPQPGARTPLITWEVRASRGNKMMEPKKLCPQTPHKIPLVYLGGSRRCASQREAGRSRE